MRRTLLTLASSAASYALLDSRNDSNTDSGRVETLLLQVTCGWIVLEAVHCLRFHAGDVKATVCSFVVMAVCILVDASRSRALERAATKKYNSQALEADALHFRTDIWSSSVVIVGLAAVKMADWFPTLRWLRAGDAVAALGVLSAIAVWVSLQLGRRTVDALVDKAPEGIEQSISDVRDCHDVRVRASGPNMFIDLHVLLDGKQPLSAAHDLTEEIEAAILRLIPGADVTVHAEPF